MQQPAELDLRVGLRDLVRTAVPLVIWFMVSRRCQQRSRRRRRLSRLDCSCAPIGGSVGVLPFSARLTDVARSVKRLCALEGIPVRRPLTMEVLVIVRPGLLTPADIRIFLALGRQHGHVTAI